MPTKKVYDRKTACCRECGNLIQATILASDSQGKPILSHWEHAETGSIYCFDGSPKTAEPIELLKNDLDGDLRFLADQKKRITDDLEHINRLIARIKLDMALEGK